MRSFPPLPERMFDAALPVMTSFCAEPCTFSTLASESVPQPVAVPRLTLTTTPEGDPKKATVSSPSFADQVVVPTGAVDDVVAVPALEPVRGGVADEQVGEGRADDVLDAEDRVDPIAAERRVLRQVHVLAVGRGGEAHLVPPRPTVDRVFDRGHP